MSSRRTVLVDAGHGGPLWEKTSCGLRERGLRPWRTDVSLWTRTAKPRRCCCSPERAAVSFDERDTSPDLPPPSLPMQRRAHNRPTTTSERHADLFADLNVPPARSRPVTPHRPDVLALWIDLHTPRHLDVGHLALSAHKSNPTSHNGSNTWPPRTLAPPLHPHASRCTTVESWFSIRDPSPPTRTP